MVTIIDIQVTLLAYKCRVTRWQADLNYIHLNLYDFYFLQQKYRNELEIEMYFAVFFKSIFCIPLLNLL